MENMEEISQIVANELGNKQHKRRLMASQSSANLSQKEE